MTRSVSVLIVDGAAPVRVLLRMRGHGWTLAEADSDRQMRERIEAERPDIVMLEQRLPGEDGLALARDLRERCDVGIINVTASSEVIDRVVGLEVGLEVGADDNVARPFDPRELLARVKSVPRRLQARPAAADEAPALAGTAAAMAAAAASAVRQRIGRCELDQQSRRLFESGGPEVTFTAMEFELLRVFLGNPNRVLSRDQLLVAQAQPQLRTLRPFDRHPHRPAAAQGRARARRRAALHTHSAQRRPRVRADELNRQLSRPLHSTADRR